MRNRFNRQLSLIAKDKTINKSEDINNKNESVEFNSKMFRIKDKVFLLSGVIIVALLIGSTFNSFMSSKKIYLVSKSSERIEDLKKQWNSIIDNYKEKIEVAYDNNNEIEVLRLESDFFRKVRSINEEINKIDNNINEDTN